MTCSAMIFARFDCHGLLYELARLFGKLKKKSWSLFTGPLGRPKMAKKCCWLAKALITGWLKSMQMFLTQTVTRKMFTRITITPACKKTVSWNLQFLGSTLYHTSFKSILMAKVMEMVTCFFVLLYQINITGNFTGYSRGTGVES